jgi:hypothetical protein
MDQWSADIPEDGDISFVHRHIVCSCDFLQTGLLWGATQYTVALAYRSSTLTR